MCKKSCLPRILENKLIKFVIFFSLAVFGLTFSLDGWSCGAMVLGKLPVPGRHANLDHSGLGPMRLQ